MSSASERRNNADRRRAARGGRRPKDEDGTAPLVMVVGNGRDPESESERILGELKLAVAPAADLTEALRVVDTLRPDLIVARPQDAARLRERPGVTVAIVEYTGAGDKALIERVRAAMRRNG
ncbi:MAG: hypothetical protein H0W08_02215 [Acidobacteria bacterium]|nr:hypothetical protein [Acidobacteriota bacterium]